VTLEQLDAELAEAAACFERSEEEARAWLATFELVPPDPAPADPFSEAYTEWVFALYRAVSGRPAYSTENERSPFDVEAAARHPYPWATGSTRILGEELVARGLALKALGLDPPGRVVEFGPGWGNLTWDLASLGFDVTGVEVEPRFAELATRRVPEGSEASDPGGRLTMVTADMLAFRPDEPFDAAVFYESFHHCADHRAMLARLHQLLRPPAVVVFAAEPVAPLPYPWGPRLDGYSLWSTRVHGWLELGFDPAYFRRALARTGWRAQRHRATSLSPLADVWVARPV
jgi:SAM-dependent methyltransferase